MGSFFHNSSFEKDHKQFLQSVRNVLNQWGVSPLSDDINSYRSLRNQKFAEENRAVSFTEEQSCHKVSRNVEYYS